MLDRHREDGMLVLALSRPDTGNALSADLVEALLAAVEAACSEDVHTLVIQGRGRNFCTGFDLANLESLSDGDLLQRFVRVEMLLAALWQAPFRTVALAHGRAWGAGADLFVCCDVRIAQEGTTFCFPGAGFGLVLGTRRLAERIGPDQARRCATTGLVLDASHAAQLGLATEVVDEGQLASMPARLPALGVDRQTLAQLNRATRLDCRDQDLAALARSAAVPGLKHRIQAYRARQLARRRH